MHCLIPVLVEIARFRIKDKSENTFINMSLSRRTTTNIENVFHSLMGYYIKRQKIIDRSRPISSLKQPYSSPPIKISQLPPDESYRFLEDSDRFSIFGNGTTKYAALQRGKKLQNTETINTFVTDEENHHLWRLLRSLYEELDQSAAGEG